MDSMGWRQRDRQRENRGPAAMNRAAAYAEAPTATIMIDRGRSGHTVDAAAQPAQAVPGLAVIWSRTEPERAGEVAIVRGSERCAFGRAPQAFHPRPLLPVRWRAGQAEPRALRSPGISRVQWLVRRTGRGLEIENVGRAALHHHGRTQARVTAAVGDVVEIAGELALRVHL